MNSTDSSSPNHPRRCGEHGEQSSLLPEQHHHHQQQQQQVQRKNDATRSAHVNSPSHVIDGCFISSKDSESPGSTGTPLPFHPREEDKSRIGFGNLRDHDNDGSDRRQEQYGHSQQHSSRHDGFASPPRQSHKQRIAEGMLGQNHSQYSPPYDSRSPPSATGYNHAHGHYQPEGYVTSTASTSHVEHATAAPVPRPPPPYHYPYHYPLPIMTPSQSSDTAGSYPNYHHYQPQPPPPYSYALHPASFESSHGSAAAATPPTPYMPYSSAPGTAGAATTVIAYPPSAPIHHHHHPSAAHYYPPPPFAPWTMMTHPPPPPNYITDITSQDVLCGRGGATNSHSGNREFRILVKKHQTAYLRAKKRDKPAVASRIVEAIRKRGGRFLRKVVETMPLSGNHLHANNSSKDVLWLDIGDDRAREKTCQALREGAPELRKRRSRSFEQGRKIPKDDSMVATEEDESSLSSSMDGRRISRALESPRKTDGAMSGRTSHDERPRGRHDGADHLEDARDDSEGRHDEAIPVGNSNTAKKEPTVIRPSARLMKRSTMTQITMQELTPAEREMYLRDFLPPESTMRTTTKRREVHRVARHYEPVAEDDDSAMMDKDDDDYWVDDE